jgi:GDP-4-dehydro-6-deoxy-D-mannose reductase
MRALLTGGNGFVGRHLAEHLRHEGDEVTVLDLPDDITDGAVVERALRNARPDAIYHLAALSHVGSSWSDPSAVLRVNVIGSAVVFAKAREVVPEATTLFVSSAEVYGAVQPDQLPLNESCTPAPISPYAASKLAGEVVAQQAVRAFGQRIVIARPFNHVGPGQTPHFFVPALATRMVEAVRVGRREIPVGNLTSRRDFLDVRDVVAAYRLLVERGESGEVYNIASGVDRSMNDIADEIRSLVDESLAFVTDEELMRPVDVPVLRGESKKINAATGWSPRWSWSETLADVIASVRESY